ncbi:MAG: outer membrane protein [Chitinophagaceae bacterium]
MKKYLGFLFLLSILYKNELHAQLRDSYIKGSVELQTGQSLNGYIKDDELAKMNFKISYKENETGKSFTIYDTSQIKSFKLDDGEIYEWLRFRGQYMTGDIAVLGKLIIMGKASLYKIIYNSDVLYLVKNEGKVYVLQNDKMDKSQMSTELTKYYFKSRLKEAISNPAIPVDKIEKISFSEKKIAEIIKEYNELSGSDNQVIAVKKKPVHFIIASVGGMYMNNNRKEIYFQGIFRTYFPKISRGLSFNTGINYFNYKNLIKRGQWPFNEIIDKTYSLATIPFQLQQNFLNKKIRPYVFVGTNISHLKVTDQSGSSQIDKGLQNSFGVALLFGAGIEADIYKGIMLKTEYRDENFAHLVLVGIGYNFSRN